MTARKPPEEHQPDGRPTKYRSEFCAQAKALSKLGATEFEIAQFFRVAMSTLSLWLVQHPKFSESVRLGKGPSDKRSERSLYHRANGYTYESEEIYLVDEIEYRPVYKPDGTLDAQAKPMLVTTKKVLRVPTLVHVPPDPNALKFWLKNRKPKVWRDRHDLTLANPPGKTFRTEVAADPEPIGKYYERLAQIAADRAVRRPLKPVGGARVPDDPDDSGAGEG